MDPLGPGVPLEAPLTSYQPRLTLCVSLRHRFVDNPLVVARRRVVYEHTTVRECVGVPRRSTPRPAMFDGNGNKTGYVCM